LQPVRQSVCPSVCPSVLPSVLLSLAFIYLMSASRRNSKFGRGVTRTRLAKGANLRSKVNVNGNENVKNVLRISSWKTDRFESNQDQDDHRPTVYAHTNYRIHCTSENAFLCCSCLCLSVCSVTHLSFTQYWNSVESSYFMQSLTSYTNEWRSNFVIKIQRSKSLGMKMRKSFCALSSRKVNRFPIGGPTSNQHENGHSPAILHRQIHITSGNLWCFLYLSAYENRFLRMRIAQKRTSSFQSSLVYRYYFIVSYCMIAKMG